jgi:alkyl hydroperoxide reductase subunit AhpC
MWIRSVLSPLLAAGFLVTAAAADEPAGPRAWKAAVKLPPLDPDKLSDPKEAARAIQMLDKQYPEPQPEAVRMLIAILKGSQLNGTDGWFGPAQTRYTWQWIAERHGVDAKTGAITADKFRGPPALFEALDRDGDGKITASDLDWSDRNPYVMRANMLTALFRRMDASGAGKLTREEFDELFKRLAEGKDHFTADDFRRAMLPRGPAGFAPGDGPSIPVLVRGLYAGEIGSIQEGPAVGEAAPDFTLKAIDGKETIQLSKQSGKKPVVLVFGNFTCGPFRGLFPDVDAVYGRYKDRATFIMVYVREAHPTDGWKMQSNTQVGVAVKQPTTTAERAEVCELFRKKLKPGMPVLVDEIGDPAGTAYSAMPARLYVIDTDGKVAYKSGRGPFGFKPSEMEQALAMSLLEASPAKKPDEK